jgi:hypothetical protein
LLGSLDRALVYVKGVVLKDPGELPTGDIKRFVKKSLEGAIFPLQIKSLKNGIDDAVHALNIHKANHGCGPPSYYDEITLNHIGGAQFAPQVLG